MNYTVTQIPNKNYDLFGVKLFNGVTYCYWKNKNRSVITDVVVIPNNANVVNVRDGQICISLEGISSFADKENVIRTFLQEVSKVLNINLIKFQFIVENKQQEADAQQIVSGCGLKSVIERTGDYKGEWEAGEKLRNNSKQELEREKKKDAEKFGKANDGLYSDKGTVSRDEQVADDVEGLSNDKMGMSSNLAEDARVGNTERGIASEGYQYGTTHLPRSRENQGGAIGMQGGNINDMGNRISVVNPVAVQSNVEEIGSKVTGLSSSSNYRLESGQSKRVEADDNFIQPQRELKKYYKETDENGVTIVYDEEGKKISELDFNRYLIDENNNFIIDGQVMGAIDGELKELEEHNKNSSQLHSKTNIYRREIDKNAVHGLSDDRAAFVSLPVIIFIISFILLVVSGIILFMMK